MSTTVPKRYTRSIYFFLFALSGLAGLIYESIWTHYLKLFLGHASYAQTLVLAIFMGGMAIGAYLISRLSSKIGNLLLAYAIVEGIIGLCALVFHQGFTWATALVYYTVIPALDSTLLVDLCKWTVAALLILPQSILLGTTFPLMSGGIMRRFPDAPGYAIAFLYFTNSLGAAIGILLSGFVLIEAVGLPGTILFAGMLNLVLALIVWFLCRGAGTSGAQPLPVEASTRRVPARQHAYMAFMLCAAVTGAASFLYEIGWIRMLSLVLGSSTHAFELMLSAFILGLACGGFWIKKRLDHFANPVAALGIIQLTMGSLALATIPMYSQTFDLMSYIIRAVTKTPEGYLLFNLSSHGIAMLVMLPATFCAGMTLPLLTAHLVSRKYGERAIGGVYAANTVGAILGVIVGSQWIMPIMGVKSLIAVGVGLDMALGLGLLWYATPAMSTRRWSLVAGSMVLLFATITGGVAFDPMKTSSGVYRHGLSHLDGEILYHKDGKTATIDIRKISTYLLITTNGKPEASIGVGDKVAADEWTMILLGALPLAINHQSQTVAVIGLGAGITTNTLLTLPTIQAVDTIEIEAAVVEGARYFNERVTRVYNDPRSHIHIEDAKTFFVKHQKQYDLIVSEPSNPWVSGVAGLFSEEFYRLIYHYVTPGGMFVQWIHLYENNVPLVASIMKAMSPVFTDYALYQTLGLDAMIIATKGKQLADPSARIFDFPALKAQLDHIKIQSIQDLSIRKLGSKKSLEALFQSFPILPNSDYFPVLDLGSIKARFLKQSAKALNDLLLYPLPIMETLHQQPNIDNRLHINHAQEYDASGQASHAMQIYQYFANGLPDTTATSTPTVIKLVSDFVSLPNGCEPRVIEVVWLPRLQALMSTVLPHLSAREMEVIWNRFASSACADHLPEQVDKWVALYKAIGQRHYAGMLQTARALLPDGPITPSPEHHYMLSAGLLATIALHNGPEFVQLWQRYTRQDAPPLELRLLVEYGLTAVVQQ